MSATSVLQAAAALAPVLRERALDGESGRTMPPDVVALVRQSGLFHLAMPTGLGGPPEEPETIIRAIETVSAADGSAGWTTLIGNTTAFVAWLEPGVAKEIAGGTSVPPFTAASAFAPTGVAAEAGDGTLAVNGRWAFTSGSPHADWFANGIMVLDGDSPRMFGDRPDWRFAWMPAADVEVLDTWHAAGLRGTGSHDTAVTGAVVPEERTIAPFFTPAVADDALYRIPFFCLLNVFFSGFGLGVARRALDELTTLARTKSRNTDGTRMADDETIQVEIGRLEGRLAGARAAVFDRVGEVWQTVQAGDSVPLRLRAQLLGSVQHVMRTGRTLVDDVLRLAGGGALYETSPVQRCFRDLVAGSQHFAFSLSVERLVGQVLLGHEPRSIFLMGA